jgi:hypothetical protein
MTNVIRFLAREAENDPIDYKQSEEQPIKRTPAAPAIPKPDQRSLSKFESVFR